MQAKIFQKEVLRRGDSKNTKSERNLQAVKTNEEKIGVFDGGVSLTGKGEIYRQLKKEVTMGFGSLCVFGYFQVC